MPVQITVTKTYNTTNLFEDIKALYKVAGVKGQPVAFIFTDNEVKEEGFLEYINQILMTGEVAGLFAKDELDATLPLAFLAESKLKSGAEKYGCSSSTVSSVICSLGKFMSAFRKEVSPIMRTASS